MTYQITLPSGQNIRVRELGKHMILPSLGSVVVGCIFLLDHEL